MKKRVLACLCILLAVCLGALIGKISENAAVPTAAGFYRRPVIILDAGHVE